MRSRSSVGMPTPRSHTRTVTEQSATVTETSIGVSSDEYFWAFSGRLISTCSSRGASADMSGRSSGRSSMKTRSGAADCSRWTARRTSGSSGTGRRSTTKLPVAIRETSSRSRTSAAIRSTCTSACSISSSTPETAPRRRRRPARCTCPFSAVSGVHGRRSRDRPTRCRRAPPAADRPAVRRQRAVCGRVERDAAWPTPRRQPPQV